MTNVKICGITNLEDALMSVHLGADALGFNFYFNSPRYITTENAKVIVEQLPSNVLKVGVFVDADCDSIEAAVVTAGLTAIQLHGSESPEFAAELRDRLCLPVIKAFRISPAFSVKDLRLFDVDAILLDAYSPYRHGGTGETFDWEIARAVLNVFPKMYLAGGLSPENVRSAISEVAPFAVDACSSLESAQGRKDHKLLSRFIAEVKVNA